MQRPRGLPRTDAAGPTVQGDVLWSLLAHFAWISGFGERFGLIAVKGAIVARSIKPRVRGPGVIARANARMTQVLTQCCNTACIIAPSIGA